MVRPTLIDLNPVEFKYYPFMISLVEVVMTYCKKSVFQKKTKDTNVKAFNMITNKSEAKTMKKHILYDCRCKLNSATCSSNKKWNRKTCRWKCKNYRTCKKRLQLESYHMYL